MLFGEWPIITDLMLKVLVMYVGVGGWGVRRLIQNKFFRILSNAKRICVWIFKAYFVKKKKF